LARDLNIAEATVKIHVQHILRKLNLSSRVQAAVYLAGRSGASVSDPAVHTAFCGPGERLANWVIAGRPVRAAHPKAGAEASAVISGWRMDQG
jgi:hypothetical protein